MDLLGAAVLLALTLHLLKRMLRATWGADHREKKSPAEDVPEGIDRKLAREMRRVADRIGRFYD